MTRLKMLADVLAAALVTAVLTPAAHASDAQATVALNVRSGPGAGFAIVDTLARGEVVDMTECQTNGWCYITHPGPDGWVNSRYLTAPAGAASPGPNCRFELTIGSDGPRFAIVCGDGPGASPGSILAGNRACFYADANYSGARFCRGVGIINNLPPAANDRMSSVRLYGTARARLCVNPNLGGFCRTLTSSEAQLGPWLNDRVSSVRVFTGSLPPATPTTFSTGSINLPVGARANLDFGTVAPGGADIWYRQITPLQRRLVPVNGAQLARGDGSNRGFAGCRTESFSSAPLPVAALPVGTYVCARTNAGRISQFRVNAYTLSQMRIGYTTWEN